MKSNVTNKFVLIGIPNSGKSTIGRLAAEKLQIPFYNTDELVYKKLNINPANPAKLFTCIGQFMVEHRKLETKLAELEGPAIIEINPESAIGQSDVEVMKNMGTIIHIKRNLNTMLAEAMKKKSRMVVEYMNTGRKVDIHSEAIRLYAKDLHHLEKLADLTLDNDGGTNEGVEKLVSMIRNLMET